MYHEQHYLEIRIQGYSKYELLHCFLNSGAGLDEITKFIQGYSEKAKSDAIVCMFLAPSKLIENHTVGNNVVSSLKTVKYYINSGDVDSDSNKVIDFADVLENPDSLEARDIADEWLAMSVEVNKVMYKLRYYAKIEFPSDYEEE